MTLLPLNCKHAFRRLLRTPGFTLIAVGTIALVLGINTAVFGVLDALLLRLLPYNQPDRLVHIWETIHNSDHHNGVAVPNFVDLAHDSQSFSSLAAWSTIEADLTGNGKAQRVIGEIVSPGYFSTLDVHAALGRDFNSGDDLGHPAVILSHALWQSRFNSDPAVIGRTVNISGSAFVVLGVMPRGFRGYSGTATLWVPLATHTLIYPAVAQYDFVNHRDIHWIHVLGRLKAGVTPSAADAEVQGIGQRLVSAFPKANKDRGLALAPAQQDWSRESKPAMLALLAAGSLVLLVACANLTNLFLVRFSRRSRELAVRVALGASQANLLSVVFWETAIVAVSGALTAIALFALTKNALIAVLPIDVPSFAVLRLDSRVIAYACGALLVTIASITVLPALYSSSGSPLSALVASGSRSETDRHRRARNVVAAAEVAFSVLLTIGAGLLLKSLWHLQNVDPGFNPDHLITLRFDVPNDSYQGDARRQLGDLVADRAAAVPGVESAAVTAVDPFVWPGINRNFTPEGRDPVANPQNFYNEEISPGYFRTMGIPLLAGRDFTAHDDPASAPTVIVSESFARRYWPGENALGKRVRFGGASSSEPWATIVGIAGDAQLDDLRSSRHDLAIIYAPLRRSEVIIGLSLVVRTRINAAAMIGPMREMLQSYDSNFPVSSEATLRERMAGQSASARGYAILMVCFGSIALVLAILGVYGVFAYSVAQRTREIGIRLALGAQRKALFTMITSQALRIAAVGVFVGVVSALALSRWLSHLLFEVRVTDPVVYIAASALLLAAAIVASYLPARRAASVQPTEALRDQ